MNSLVSFVPTLGIPTLEVPAPKLEYSLLAPLLAVLIGAFLGVILEAVLPRHHRRDAQALVAGLTLVGALVATVLTWRHGYRQDAALGSIVVDGPTLAAWAMLVVFGGLSLILFAERRVTGGQSAFAPMAAAVPGSPLERDAIAARTEHTEVFPLLMLSLFGMMLFASSGDLLTMFVALEILSLPLYLLSGLARRRRLLSQEAALKYFLLGAMSSGLFLYGTALLYGYAGSFHLAAIDTAISAGRQSNAMLITGMALVTIGLLFKVGAVPFHSWTPDVYQGAPTPVTGFMSICTKLAAMVALARVLYAGLGAVRWDWQPLIAVIAVLSMLVGSILGLVQTDIKRMLAYSSIAQAGFLLVPLAGAATPSNGLKVGQIGSFGSMLFYLAAYGFATLGAFALLMVVQKTGGEATTIASWRGIGRRHPLIAGVMALFFLSFAGLPPTAGFVGKLVAFLAAWRGGYGWLVLVAVICSLIAAGFYLRFVLVMFFQDATDEDVQVVKPGYQTIGVAVVCAVMVLVMGIVAGPFADAFQALAGFLR